MPDVPVVTGAPVNGLQIYCILWIGIAVCVLGTGFVLHCDLRAIVAALNQLSDSTEETKDEGE